MKLRSLAGQRFDRLLVLDQHKRTVTEFANSTGRKTWWLCRCDCGVEKWCQANHLRSGQVKSCGCLSAEIRTTGRATLHAKAASRVKLRVIRLPVRQECQTCHEVKPIAEFKQHKGRRKNGFRKTCLSCDRKYAAQQAAAWRERNPEKALEVSRAAELRRPDRSQTPESQEYHRNYYTAHKQETIARAKEWGKANPKKVLAYTVARQKKVKRATPTWSDRKAITAFYAACPLDHSVDHIIPINGKTVEGHRVSGLHVVWNLQYLPGNENYEKNNRMRSIDQALCENSPNTHRLSD